MSESPLKIITNVIKGVLARRRFSTVGFLKLGVPIGIWLHAMIAYAFTISLSGIAK